jgi:hypothetical protein
VPIVQQISNRALHKEQEFLYWFKAEREKSPEKNTNTLIRQEKYYEGALNSRECFPPGHCTKNTYAPYGIAKNGYQNILIIEQSFFVVPLKNDIDLVIKILRDKGISMSISDTSVDHVKIKNAELVGLVASTVDGDEILYFTSIDYPVVPPVVLYRHNKIVKNLLFSWDGINNKEHSLHGIAEILHEELRIKKKEGGWRSSFHL